MEDRRAATADQATESFQRRKDGTYLITGGLGALGLQIAQWLGDRGARHIALMSRRSPDEAAQQAIKNLEATGLQVTAIQGDVADSVVLAEGTPTAAGGFAAGRRVSCRRRLE